MRVIALIACSIAATACDQNGAAESFRELEGLRVSHASSDAERAIEGGDQRLLGILGAGCEVPGTAFRSCEEAELTRDVRVLEGTSDDILSDRHLRLVRNARRYAAAYNAAVLASDRQN